jgi:hypothetical protein
MDGYKDLSDAVKVKIVNAALYNIKKTIDNRSKYFPREGEIPAALREAAGRLGINSRPLTAAPPSAAAAPGAYVPPHLRQTAAPPPPLPTPFAAERHSAAGGGAVAAGPAIDQSIKGAIIIVRDTSTGHILLGREGVQAIQGSGAKRYGDNPTQDESLQFREQLTAAVYQRIINDEQIIQNAAAESARRNRAVAAAGGGGGVDLLLPLVEKAESKKNLSGNPQYGSHPRIRKDPNNPDHTINFGAPKGGSKKDGVGNIIENHLDTAQREFIEEVGHVFPDNRYQYNGTVNGYAVYLIDITAAERKLIEKRIAARYARHIGETFDLGFIDPTTVPLNAMTRDALKKLGIIPP